MRILTVISNFNEEKAIRDTILDVLSNSTIKTDILVIDNCSTDNSIEIVKELNINYLKHPVNTGGSAGVIKTAFAYAYYHNYDIYCHMDGDNQHMASELEKVVAPIFNGEVDVVTGSRFIEKKGFQSSFMRRLGIVLFSKMISLVTKSKFTDITSGFRAYNYRAIKFFATQFKQEIETITQLELVMHYGGLKRRDVPVLMKPRLTGRSEINFTNAVKFPIYNFIGFIGTLLQKR
ncbi:MAG: glycosyl transferase family 2 [Bacteroidetes bacterium HGW-Bacteroidetes-15]|nr:MAG: glycosyl transferase family 2 [Bacteroidetes bacterium HGW-Bacteroidetes-15]